MLDIRIWLILVATYLDIFSCETGVKKLTIPSKNTHPACKKNDIFHSDVVEDRSLKSGISPQNYTLLGDVPTMGDCMALCCSTKHCTVAYMKNNTCYGVTCYDSDKCGVSNSTFGETSGTQLALIIRNEMNRRVYVTAYLVVVVCAFGAAMAGTVWAVFVFYKRYSYAPSNQRLEEKKPMLEDDVEEAMPKRMPE